MLSFILTEFCSLLDKINEIFHLWQIFLKTIHVLIRRGQKKLLSKIHNIFELLDEFEYLLHMEFRDFIIFIVLTSNLKFFYPQKKTFLVLVIARGSKDTISL